MPSAFCACRWGTETLTPDSLQGENKLKIRHRIFPLFSMISPPNRHGENNCSAPVKISSDVVEISSEPVKISSELVEISSELVLKETEKISTSAESLIISIFRKTTNAVCPSLLSRYSQPPNAANVGSSWAV